MKYSLAVYGAPYSSESSDSAFRFANALLDRGHEIHRIFFYQDGVHNASNLATPPQDEPNIPSRWAQFIEANNIDAVVCVAAALRRGVLDPAESTRHEKPASNTLESFSISGLGQLIEAGIESDRLITFGS